MAGPITAEELDRLFDAGQLDVLDYFDTDTPIVIDPFAPTLAVTVPGHVYDVIVDRSASLGLTRQELIEQWVRDSAQAA
jgi:hypothetical protein